MTTFDTLHAAERGATDTDAPLVVLLHGRGANENDTPPPEETCILLLHLLLQRSGLQRFQRSPAENAPR